MLIQAHDSPAPLDLTHALGLGVAGNFAGHLEQAGEAGDFREVTAAAGKPKGVFPFYVPLPHSTAASDPVGEPHFLQTYPISRDRIAHPGTLAGRPAQLQIEPELALLCTLDYETRGEGRRVVRVAPFHFAAYNDCSTRRPDARKISEKKNWGSDTKGLAHDQWIALDPADHFDPGSNLDRFRLACYLRRDGQLHPYGEDSPVAGPDGYSTMYRPLLDWLTHQLNHQADHGPLEDLPRWLAAADYPPRAVISIGATRYTPLGESTYLQPGDESIVLAYDTAAHPPDSIIELIQRPPAGAGITYSLLRQTVESTAK